MKVEQQEQNMNVNTVNCGFKSNESLSIHYNQIHAVAPEPIEGYENWKDVADDLYEKEQARRKKGGEALDIFENPMTMMKIWDIALTEYFRDLKKFKSNLVNRDDYLS